MDLEKNSLTREELLKVHKRRKITIVTNIFLIIVILIIIFYVISNVELVKTMNQDFCKICELKTGAECMVYNFKPTILP